jgi:tetratricopeptide (TPR) repeat protein
MLRKRKAEGLMAQALYEQLSESEAAFLEAYFHDHPEASREMDAMRQFVETLPANSPAFDTDLVPAVRVRIEEEGGEPESGWWFRLGALAGAFAVVAAVLGVALINLQSPPEPGGNTVARSERGAPATSPLAVTIKKSQELTVKGNFADAYKALSEALERSPEAPEAGNAQMMLAGIAFEHLHWYEQAYEDYERLFREYHQTWLGSPAEVRDRRDLLAEARLVQFRSLHDLDAARSNNLDPMGALARVITTYPNQAYVRSEAAMEMAKCAIESGAIDAESPDALVQALRHAQQEVSDPMVVAQLAYQMGHLYESEYRQFDKAREAFLKASQHPALQQQARSALARLDSSARE